MQVSLPRIYFARSRRLLVGNLKKILSALHPVISWIFNISCLKKFGVAIAILLRNYRMKNYIRVFEQLVFDFEYHG